MHASRYTITIDKKKIKRDWWKRIVKTIFLCSKVCVDYSCPQAPQHTVRPLYTVHLQVCLGVGVMVWVSEQRSKEDQRQY